MPRPTKVFRRQKVNAGIAWKRGDKKEAYELWEKAAAALKEHRTKKRNKNKPAPQLVTVFEGAGQSFFQDIVQPKNGLMREQVCYLSSGNGPIKNHSITEFSSVFYRLPLRIHRHRRGLRGSPAVWLHLL